MIRSNVDGPDDHNLGDDDDEVDAHGDMYSAKQSIHQDIISQKSFKSHKVGPSAVAGDVKIGSREFAGFANAKMGETMHNEPVNNHNKTIFSGVTGKLEVGKLQRQYSRGGKRSAHSVHKNAEQFNRIGDKSMGSFPIDHDEDD